MRSSRSARSNRARIHQAEAAVPIPVRAPALRVGARGVVAALSFDVLLADGVLGVPGALAFGLLVALAGRVARAARSPGVVPG